MKKSKKKKITKSPLQLAKERYTDIDERIELLARNLEEGDESGKFSIEVFKHELKICAEKLKGMGADIWWEKYVRKHGKERI